jgi:hypothetical protein
LNSSTASSSLPTETERCSNHRLEGKENFELNWAFPFIKYRVEIIINHNHVLTIMPAQINASHYQKTQNPPRRKQEKKKKGFQSIRIYHHHYPPFLHHSSSSGTKEKMKEDEKAGKKKTPVQSITFEKPVQLANKQCNAMQSAVWPASFSPLLSSLFVLSRAFGHSGIRSLSNLLGFQRFVIVVPNK